MNAPALPLTLDLHGDASLGAFLGLLAAHEGRKLVISYGGRLIQPGYHVTEVKAGSFVTLDCGGNPDSWRETILQVEDLPASEKTPEHMTVGRFLAILDKVAQRVALDPSARLTFEVGPAGEPMQVFDAGTVSIEADRVLLRLAARPAICKPRHRAEQEAAPACCAPQSKCC
ncbi:DUF6428 family protein [Roseococcus sp. YIM B11640]|uniref:DUF6428 family protein n=1 Tax=Roseococcus sp. YIM B11640 TaxID=3133973 RepID=UPI003C7AFAFA